MSIWITPERNALRKTVRAFAEREIAPHMATTTPRLRPVRKFRRTVALTAVSTAGVAR